VKYSQEKEPSMQPEQLRAARAVLNWSLERLAEASGVHRNTLSNFETRKYDGDPEKLAAVQRALEAAGIIFIEENSQAAGVRMRRFQIGDLVRYRPETRARSNYPIGSYEIGTVVGVDPHPPPTGPTYRIQVQFPRTLVGYAFRFQYELVRTALEPIEIDLLQQLEKRDQTISGNRSRRELTSLIKFGFVAEQSLNMSDTIYTITDAGRAALTTARQLFAGAQTQQEFGRD
jgi:transcriptional regulator with XRE-family HTH domain